MLLSCNDLPDEILSIFIRHMGKSAQMQASLLSKRWHRLVQPELFRKVDLQKLKPVQAERLYDALFGSTGSTQGSLRDQHVHTLTNSLDLSRLDREDLPHKQSVVCSLIKAVGSISILELELVLMSYENQTFKDVLLPALETFFACARDKVTTIKLVVRDGAGLNGFPEGESAEVLAEQLSAVFALFPYAMLSSLELRYMSFASLPPALTEIWMPPAMKSLSLDSCDKACNQLTHLRDMLHFALRFRSGTRGAFGLEAGLNACKNSAATLQSLTLNDIGTAWSRPEAFVRSSALILPQLSRLHLSETTDPVREESLFNTVFSFIAAPMLKSLELETEHVVFGAKAILGKLESLTNIRKLKIKQKQYIGYVRLPKFQASPYQTLEEVCLERHISLECSLLASAGPHDELTYEFDRLEVFARTISNLSLGLQGRSLAQIDRQLPLTFPKLLHLSVQLMDIYFRDSSSSRGWKMAENDILRPLLRKLACPNLKTLQFEPYLNKENGVGIYNDLEQVLQEGVFPSLESLEGRLYAVPGMARGVLQALQQKVRVACHSAGVDYSKMEFILPDEE